MACAAWFELLSAAVDGEIGDSALRTVDEHCKTCPSCDGSRRRMEDLRRRSLVRVPHEASALSAAILGRSTSARNRHGVRGRVLALATAATMFIATVVVSQSFTSDDSPPPDMLGGEPVVTIKAVDDEFEADILTVGSGTTIEWENDGRHTHRLVRDLGGAVVSSDLAPGTVDSVTFNHAGEYEYYCSIHEGMSGRILVES